LETIGVTVPHRLFLRHLGHVIGVKIARRLCLRLGVTIATAFTQTTRQLAACYVTENWPPRKHCADGNSRFADT